MDIFTTLSFMNGNVNKRKNDNVAVFSTANWVGGSKHTENSAYI